MPDEVFADPVDRCLVEACRRRGDLPEMGGIPIETLLQRAKGHQVLGLVLQVLARHPETAGDPAVADGLRRIRRRAAVVELALDRLLSAFADAGISTMWLKGAALAQTAYDDPVQRDFGDLDLLAPEGEWRAAVGVLEGLGYEIPSGISVEVYREHHFHIPLSQPGHVPVEVHWALCRPAAAFRVEAADMIVGRREISRGERPPMTIPDRETMLLHLVLQNCSEGFARLGRLVDIDRMLADGTEFDWERVVEAARRGGLATSLGLTLQLAERLLQAPVPVEIIDELRPTGWHRWHLDLFRPPAMLLGQRLERNFFGHRLLLIWLLDPGQRRLASVRSLLQSDVELLHRHRFGPARRVWRLGRLAAVQLGLYLGGLRPASR